MTFKHPYYAWFRIVCIAILLSSNANFCATWRVLWYMDASDSLTDMAFKNITDILRGAPDDAVEFMLQLHAYDRVGLRYKATGNSLTYIDAIPLHDDEKNNFIDAVSWAFEDHEVDYTMLILSNHGWGALDPRWNADLQAWQAAEITLGNEASDVCTGTCPASAEKCVRSKLLRVDRWQHHMKYHKGFMFTAQQTYLCNAELAQGLEYLQNNVLHGKKLDVIAFDTCMGSMLEVATCVAPHADYLLGVQSCALRDGFDYVGFMPVLNQGLAPRETAIEFVRVFDEYYRDHDADGIYTCAALDLTKAESVNSALNNVVDHILTNQGYLTFMHTAREKTPRFCLWPIYTDLIAFCTLIEKSVDLVLAYRPDEIAVAHQLFNDLYQAADTMVIARCGGQTTNGNAYGFSVYLPNAIIDESYIDSAFAQQSRWVDLLQALNS